MKSGGNQDFRKQELLREQEKKKKEQDQKEREEMKSLFKPVQTQKVKLRLCKDR